MTTGPEDEPPAGSMRFQDESTTPREPTVGEARARRRAQHEQAEHEAAAAKAAAAEAETKRKRKRLLIGGAAAVGVVGVVAALYAVSGGNDSVGARCVDSSGVVVSDTYCGGSHNYGSGGVFLFAGGSYRYNYGGSGSIGQKASGGSATAPKSATVTGSSGSKASSGSSKSSVSRGGLGGGSKSSSGSSKSSGS